MKAKEIQDLIDFISQSGLEEVNIETEQFKISVKRSLNPTVSAMPAQAAPMPTPAPSAAPQSVPSSAESSGGSKAETPAQDDDAKYVTIKSPMIGTMYRSPNPESPPFVNVGDTIKAGDTVCIVEAMKLFNEIESEVSGTIVKVLADNSSPVEYDQPLFLVDPS